MYSRNKLSLKRCKIARLISHFFLRIYELLIAEKFITSFYSICVNIKNLNVNKRSYVFTDNTSSSLVMYPCRFYRTFTWQSRSYLRVCVLYNADVSSKYKCLL